MRNCVLGFFVGVVFGLATYCVVDVFVLAYARGVVEDQRLQRTAAASAFCNACGCECGDWGLSWVVPLLAKVEGCGSKATIRVRQVGSGQVWIGEGESGHHVQCSRTHN